MKFYHATYGAYLDSIMEKGLIPNYNATYGPLSKSYVYLSTDEDNALSFASMANVPEEHVDMIVVLRIDDQYLNIENLEIDRNVMYDWETEEEFLDSVGGMPYSFQYNGPIPPEAITIYSKYRLSNNRRKITKIEHT